MNPKRKDRIEFETTFDKIAAERGEEAAINAGIAADPDAWELSDEEMTMLRPAAEVHSETDSRNGYKRTKVRVFRETESGEETVREFAVAEIDLDIAERFWEGGEDWQERLNDTLRKTVFGSEAKAADTASGSGNNEKGGNQ